MLTGDHPVQPNQYFRVNRGLLRGDFLQEVETVLVLHLGI